MSDVIAPGRVFRWGPARCQKVCMGVFPKHHLPWSGLTRLYSSIPSGQVRLKLADRLVDALAEDHLVEFVQHRFAEALADAVGLRALRIGAAVID